MIDVKTRWATYNGCYLTVDEYARTGTVAVQLWDDEGPIASLTVCLPDAPLLNKNDAYIDTNDFPEAMDVIKDYGLAVPLGYSARSGYCWYPAVEFDMDALKKHTKGDC